MSNILLGKISNFKVSYHPVFWFKPSQGVIYIKLNVDATTKSSASWLVVLARDGDGNLLCGWAKDIPLCDPPIA